jgi:two-component system chemotaxis response regulator CheY
MTDGAAAPIDNSSPSRLILLVEDNPMVGEVVQAMLHMGGFRSVHASGPQEALAMLQEPNREFDLILTDFRMPRMTGIELIQHARTLRPGIKTILYSGNADESVTAGYAIQPDRFLRKPFAPRILNDLVREVLTG